jgi:hypothetical protein
MVVRCRCGRNTTYGVLCGFCSKNYVPRGSRPPEEIDEFDEEYDDIEEEDEED